MKKKQEFITKEYFTKTLDKRFSEQAKVIIEAITEKFAENKKEHQQLRKTIDDNWNNIERYIKAQEAFRQEFVIMNPAPFLLKS